MGAELGFEVFELLFLAVLLAAMVVLAVQLAKWLQQWNHNAHAMQKTVEATVVSKRTEITWQRDATEAGMHGYRTNSYFVTFRTAEGRQLELQVKGHQYGMMVEGDCGYLTFQGSRYLTYERM